MSSEGRSKAQGYDDVFRTTIYADHLRSNQRWSRYRPSEVSAAEWRQVLHADGDGLDHARLMMNLTDRYFEADEDGSSRLSAEEVELLYIAMATQNWGKSYADEYSPGKDINYEALNAEEISHRRRKLHVLFDLLAPDLDVKKRFIVERTIYDRTTKLGEVFDAIRRLNCLRTALLAYSQYSHGSDKPATENLGALSLGTLSNQLPYLITYAEKYTPVSKALDTVLPDIEAIFQDKTIRDHPMVSNQQNVEAIERTEMIWQRSHGDKSSVDPSLKRPKDDTLFSSDSAFERRLINDKSELKRVVDSLRVLGMKITLTSGSFDLLHVGHAAYLERASAFGDVLVVGVDSDAKIRVRKGLTRPVVGETERLRLLSHLRGVDILTLKEPDEEKWGVIKTVRPDTLIVTAETYDTAEIKELEELYCGRVVVLEPQATTSTGAQIRKIQIGEKVEVSRSLEEIIASHEMPERVRRELAKLIVKNDAL